VRDDDCVGALVVSTLYTIGAGGDSLIAPEKIPALPRPAIARPMMREVELGAAPQRREPISKSEMAAT
jgi:hypothetical protein